ALFRSLFRGRDDIYPRFWTNARTGRKGYAPACGNEWIRGVCEKPRVKCGECPNQAFLPVEDKVILDHLQGRHVVGVYPLLTDETCWFLAADFDKTSWTDDVAAFAETCRVNGLPGAVEPATADSVAREATRRGLVVGVRLSDTTDAESSEPWTRRPSGQPPVGFRAPLPREVRAVLAQRLFVAKGGLAPTHLNQIKRLAAFQNPEFYKKQSLRLSTALTPR